jgi:hypothetical protein
LIRLARRRFPSSAPFLLSTLSLTEQVCKLVVAVALGVGDVCLEPKRVLEALLGVDNLLTQT